MNKPKFEWKKYKNQFVILLDDEILGESLTRKKAEVELSHIGYKLLKNYKLSEIPENLISFVLLDDYDSLNIILNCPPFKLSNFYLYRNTPKEAKLSISLFFDFLNWNLPLSPNQITKLFIAEMRLNKGIDCEIDEDTGLMEIPFEISIRISINNDISIEENVNYIGNQIEEFTKKILSSKINLNPFSLDTYFLFPEEYKTACEQYLLYFATFLKDLGIEAKTDLENQENGVLFKVFPKDKEEALTQIKEALEVYLALPTQQNLEIVANDFQTIPVHQLVSNIQFLKSQVMLAQATLQAKDATITALELSYYQLKQIVDKQVEKTKNEEQMLGNIVTVKEYDGNGLKVNLPELFRLLKRKVWGK